MRRFVSVVVVACLALVGHATPAFAHNSLIGSNPANESTVQESPSTIELTFDQPVQTGEGLNTIAVTGPEGTNWTVGPAAVASNVVSAPLSDLGPTGTYRIGYRILSADGHPVSGEVTFTLAKAGDGTPAASTASDGEATAETDEGGLPIWVWILGAVVLLGAGLTVALRIGGQGR
ncbi:copper resistance CopC family protein [Actinophytocola xanthii]|uniref:Copper resistance protein CopC n=1 Tax=Actinophytocola xanthii TaxID=1912961 RepID=A0A1Q8CVE6_9PSEU|nr:copper resistance CopC family protein [Actinophytocola xanthii]OLF18330.1 copper resistance protein CopC [Actinophytocola xanthii]